MADLRIVDAPLLSTVKGTEKLPTGGEGNFSVSVNQVADFAKLKWVLATEGYVDNAVGNVQADLNLHKNSVSNPHQVTKAQVGLGNVDNTADADKPLSDAEIAALSLKADKAYVDTQDGLKADKSELIALKIISGGNQNQQNINDFGGAKWYIKSGGYELGATVKLTNGDIVRNTIVENTVNPNTNMTGWVKVNDASQIFDASGKTQQEINNLLSYASYKTPRQFGGKPDDPNFDNKYALQAAFDSKEPILLDGKYYASESLVGSSGLVIAGLGQDKSQIVKTTSTKSGLSSINIVVSSATKTDIYDVDAVLILKPNQVSSNAFDYVKAINFSNFSLQRATVDTADTTLNAIGLYAPRICQSQFKEFVAHNKVGHGIYCANPWMVSWIRCEASGRIPWCLGRAFNNTSNYMIGGTSNTLISSWAMSAKKSCFALGLQYSTLISCGADYSGNSSSPIEYVYDIESSNITIIGSSAEILYGKILKASAQSTVTLINPVFDVSQFGDGTNSALIYALGSETKVTIVGGKITPHATSANTYFTAEYGATIDIKNTSTPDVFTGFSTSSTNADKTKLHIYGNFARINYSNKGTTLNDVYNAVDAQSSQNGGLIVQNGDFGHFGNSGKFGLLNASAFRYNNAHLHLGGLEFWRYLGNVYFKDGTPTGNFDGKLLSAYLGNFTTGLRPSTDLRIGNYLLDTTLKKPMFWDGSAYFDANGGDGTKKSITGKINPTTIAEQNAVLSSIVSALTALNLVTDNRT